MSSAFLKVIPKKEEKIYEQPADESRAPELWRYSAHWLRYEKLMFYHIDTVNDMRRFLAELDDVDGVEGEWLSEIPSDLEKMQNLIQEDLVKPTSNLSELVGSNHISIPHLGTFF